VKKEGRAEKPAGKGAVGRKARDEDEESEED
jgi:hypothetical protein